MPDALTTQNGLPLPEEVHAAVLRGAEWLDEHCPDWMDHVNLDALQLQSPQYCVLGQTAECLLKDAYPRRADFGDVVGEFQELSNPEEFGFEIGYPSGGVFASYEMLNIAWRELIRTRRENA